MRRLLLKILRKVSLKALSLEWKLRHDCPHKFVKKTIAPNVEIVMCRICNRRDGWWCPESPNHCCSYTKDFDQCDYCGQPEERK